MKEMQALALLGAAVFAACAERQAATAPTADAAALTASGFIGDRPYTWSVTCSGDLGSQAYWSWTMAGVTIDSTSMVVGCYPGDSYSGIGKRPAAADGFSACVDGPTLGPAICQKWTFDPTLAFKAQLQGSGKKEVCDAWPYSLKCHQETWSIRLRVDS